MPTIQDYAIGTLTIALLLSWGFAVSPDDTHFCRARELSYYCHDVSDSGKTCYTKPFRTGGKVCYEGWEDILKDDPKLDFQPLKRNTNPGVNCDGRSCVYK
ncbi:MAG: hypothetical protein KAK00_11130 [Nanoarchaeota archaeon]|nr:hypothetical protein [Nanoarchaeota archaeon]